MSETVPNKTPLHAWHVAHGAKIVDFEGWAMPMHYEAGILKEHLATRRSGGLFDVSHMGRFRFRGGAVVSFLQHVLTSNVQALSPWHAQYTLIPNERGGVIDDAYLYRWGANDYMLVVNASNRARDLDHLCTQAKTFPGVEVIDASLETGMLSLQGPVSAKVLAEIADSGSLPDTFHNSLSEMTICARQVLVARTGYTGEPVCFELIMPSDCLAAVWEAIYQRAAVLGVLPVGLGARDTLRLEAGMPLFGHEFGKDAEGRDIPAFACPLTRVAVSFAESKGFFIGRNALARQFEEAKTSSSMRPDTASVLPRRIRCLAVLDKGVVRRGDPVFSGGHQIGVVTSGTTVPYWKFTGAGPTLKITESSDRRSIALALVDANYQPDAAVEVAVRERRLSCRLVKSHGRGEALYFRPQLASLQLPQYSPDEAGTSAATNGLQKVELLVRRALDNHGWRQERCINLIPSEMTTSTLVRALQSTDPSGRYAEHRDLLGTHAEGSIGYHGADFMEWVQHRLAEELTAYLECQQLDTRALSGQLANRIALNAYVDYRNRAEPMREPLRIQRAFCEPPHGHAAGEQPFSVLLDVTAIDKATGEHAVLQLPTQKENPYRVDLLATADLFFRADPEIIVLGRSAVLHPEPIAEICRIAQARRKRPILLYDASQVLGLLGPHFQRPFRDGADVITGSTHHTFPGPQRGIIAAHLAERSPEYEYWKAIRRRTSPGMTSNAHLGSLLGLLAAVIEMNTFKDQYQPQVLANAKAFARALKKEGLDVQGDPAASFTETHQVIVRLGRTDDMQAPRNLERNSIIVSRLPPPGGPEPSARGIMLRMGVAEMTRFGMKEKDFEELAPMFVEALRTPRGLDGRIAAFRERFLAMHYCFDTRIAPELTVRLNKSLASWGRG